MKFLCLLLVFLASSVLLYGNEGGGGNGIDVNVDDSALSWKSMRVERELNEPRLAVHISYEAINSTGSNVRVISARGDCAACGQAWASTSIVNPGQTVVVRGVVKLLSKDGNQRGSIAVETEQGGKTKTYVLSYSIKFPVSPSPPI